jgi:hypothetical protein
LRVTSSATRSPTTRPVLPRTTSATSGFFFCGIIDEPVVCASAISTKPNSCVLQSTSSSAMRERCTARWPARRGARRGNPGRPWRRGGVARGRSKPRARGHGAVEGEGRPADGAAAEGDSFSRAQSSRRPRSRSSISTSTRGGGARGGWAARAAGGCTPGGACRPPLGAGDEREGEAVEGVAHSSQASRAQRRRSVATWSLRERPVCSFAPTSPSRAVRAASTFMCTSSFAASHTKVPARTSSRICPEPRCTWRRARRR